MKRVLHIVGGMDRAGAETMIMNLYRTIDRSLIQFDFLYFKAKSCDYDEEIQGLGGNIFRIVESNPVKRYFKIVDFFKKNKHYDVIHSHTLLNSGLIVLAAKKANINKRITHAHSTKRKSNNSITDKIYEYFSRYLINNYSTHFIACGEEAAKFLFPNQKEVLILPNSIDITEYSRIGKKFENYVEEVFQIPNSILKIVQIGRLIEVKNHAFTLKIASRLKDLNANFKIILVGQGEIEHEIREKIVRRELQHHILLTGMRTDVPYLMAGSDVMLMPSLYEGFPVVLVESQAIGLPSIISDRISTEVDLGVGLVRQLNLNDDIDLWCDALINFRSSSKAREQILKEQGFDIYQNAKLLQELYLNTK